MNNKKLILLDIDGTLFDNQNRKMHPSTVCALEKIHRDHILAIATGRAGFMLDSIKAVIHLIDYFVLINGQYIKHKDEVIFEQAIDFKQLDKLVKQMQEMNIAYGFEGSLDEAVTERNEKVNYAFNGLGLSVPKIEPDFYKHHKVYQAWAFCTKEQVKVLEEANPEFKFIQWMEVGYDILPANASKGLGVKRLASYLKADYADMIAFGDGDNDYEMIKDAGLGIAMGNATKRVKSVAKYVTDDVDKDGIYKALKHFKLID